MSPEIKKRGIKFYFYSFLKFSLKLIVLFVLISVAVVALFRFLDPPTTAFINEIDRSEIANYLEIRTVDQNWVSYKNISNFPKIAVIASEDQKFIEHMGFDLKQMEIAWDDMQRGKRVRGASTLTQQVAKNLFLSSVKSFYRKGFEAYYTVLIEFLWSKKRILEVYLNIAEFGPGIFGVEAAAQYYFKKPAIKLSESESALLAAILPNPKKYRIINPSNFMVNRQQRIITQMRNIGGISILKDIE